MLRHAAKANVPHVADVLIRETRLGVPYLVFYQPLFKYYIPETIPSSSRSLRRSALMTRAQRLAGEHCMVDVRPAHALHTLNLAGAARARGE